MKKICRQGFTLIELSIVLVIIGLIVGGVLVGQDLIHAAAVRAQISQIEKYNTAVNTFLGKYNCLPGDCSTASSFGLGTSAQDGNGDGIIAQFPGLDDLILPPPEAASFWVHLAAADLFAETENQGVLTVGGVLYYHPLSRLGHGEITVNNDAGNNVFRISEEYGNAATAQAICGDETDCPSLSPAEAFAIDKKVDDGSPLSGNVQAVPAFSYGGQYWSGQPVLAGVGGVSSAVCVNNATTPNTYNLNNLSPNLCLLEFRMQ